LGGHGQEHRDFMGERHCPVVGLDTERAGGGRRTRLARPA
jgi:hypothetical protein